MKKLLLIFIILLVFNKSKAQVVFCPPGAEWHYLFNQAFSTTRTNETVKYTGDTIDGVDTLKILTHKKFFLECNGTPVGRTLIKQKGDTIFFNNNYTQNTWQLLYNFAALAGDTWVSYASYVFTVVSVQQTTVNGLILRVLDVKSNTGINNSQVNTSITERFGSSGFLFNYHDPQAAACDADFFAGRLCYQDSSFGIKQFSSTPCDYSTAAYAGLEEKKINNSIKLCPNPFENILSLKFENKNEEVNYEIRLMNILGKEILSQQKIKSEDENFILDLGSVEKGIYFVQVFEKGKVIATEKIVKE